MFDVVIIYLGGIQRWLNHPLLLFVNVRFHHERLAFRPNVFRGCCCVY